MFKGPVPPKQDVPLRLSTWLTKDAAVITSWVGDDLVLVTPEYELMGLDKMGALIWDFLGEPMSFQGLVDSLCASFGIDAATCIDDTTPMLQLLLNGGALKATN